MKNSVVRCDAEVASNDVNNERKMRSRVCAYLPTNLPTYLPRYYNRVKQRLGNSVSKGRKKGESKSRRNE